MGATKKARRSIPAGGASGGSGLAVITGAASGIGAALADELARRGYRLALMDQDGPRLKTVAGRWGAASWVVDIRDATALQAVADEIDRTLGVPELLFVNAGVAAVGPACSIPLRDARYVIDVNLMGSLHTVQAFVPSMVREGSGQVVFTGSMASLVGTPSMAVYSASKHALLGLAESLRVELVDSGVGVTVLCPGRVDTGLHGATRYHNDGFEGYVGRPSRTSLTPEGVARRAVSAALHDRPVVLLGIEQVGFWVYRLSRRVYARLAHELFVHLGLHGQEGT